jgi:hypothetical protein
MRVVVGKALYTDKPRSTKNQLTRSSDQSNHCKNWGKNVCER